MATVDPKGMITYYGFKSQKYGIMGFRLQICVRCLGISSRCEPHPSAACELGEGIETIREQGFGFLGCLGCV